MFERVGVGVVLATVANEKLSLHANVHDSTMMLSKRRMGAKEERKMEL